MHEKTLLYTALGVTAFAAAMGVYKAKSSSSHIEITPVALIDSSKGITSSEVPVRLTASDGTGLKLVALRAEAAVEDPLSLTELHLTFENPQARVLEGTFRITLPQGASLSRFAMKVGGVWQEGEVVEKQAARQAYEDFLHRKQDPALMEQGAGNEFTARVFPIPANGTKEIIVTYAEAVAAGTPYVLPLRGLPELGNLDVNVHLAGSLAAQGKTDALYGVHQQHVTPAADFMVEASRIPRSPGLRSGDLAIARVVPFAASRPETLAGAVVLVDTSASRGLGLAEQIRVLKELVPKLPADARLTVACFDQDVAPIYEGKAGGFGARELDAITARGALGASDFEQAIVWATTQAKKAQVSRVIFVTDGVATAGETDAQKLKTKVEALRGAGVTRMDAIAIGGIRDDGFLRTMTRGVLDRDGVVLDAKLGTDALARRLGEATSSGVQVKVDGARWSWPETLDGVQAGDEVLVYAELEDNKPFRVEVGGQAFPTDLRTVDRPLVQRAWAQAKIQSLVESPKESPQATKQQIIALSTRNRVLSPLTALLVLENDTDYVRFGIDRNAKVDILAVQDGRIAVTQSGRSWREDRDKELNVPQTRAKSGAEKRPSAATDTATETPTVAATATAAASAAPSPPSAPAPMGAITTTPPAEPQLEGLAAQGTGPGGGGDGFARRDDTSPSHGASAPAEESADRGRLERAPSRRPPPGHARPSGQPDVWDEPRPTSRIANRPAPPPPPPPPPSGPVDANDATTTVGVRAGALNVENGISPDEVQRVVRGSIAPVRQCWQNELRVHPDAHGRLAVRVVVGPLGDVKTAEVTDAPGNGLKPCVSAAFQRLHFPAPGNATATFTQSYDLWGSGSGAPSDVAQNAATTPKALPYEGRFKIVMEALQRNEPEVALSEANRWHADEPGDVLSLVALGEVFEARHDLASAARAYGSILELFSFRADSRRFAGERLERLGDPRALALAIDTYAKAVEERPDHPASHRLYAFALLKHGDYEKAFEAIKKGSMRSYPSGRFRGVDRILKEDMGLVAAAWMHAAPARAGEIRTKLREGGGTEENGASLRFVLVWETDANDVDFHIHDGRGGHAFYSQKTLPSGGELYADVTTGYGPECFTIRGGREQRAYPYTLQAHYYSRGPMGYGMGKLQIVEHDGKGNLSFEERPFVVMIDRAYVDMGTVDRQKPLAAAMK